MHHHPSSVPDTSEISFFSSLHGQERRKSRGIERRDLQAAVKYGFKELDSVHKGARRWRYTYADIVYITDETSRYEITSYVRPIDIPMAFISDEQFAEHDATKTWLLQNPSRCTSHTVIIVDHSASMRTSDVSDFRNRAQAVFGMLALEFVAQQRLSGEGTHTDVVSLLLMHDGVEIVCEREPLDLVLYNQFVDIHNRVYPMSHGNFLPSIELAEQMLSYDYNASKTSALCLLFLSDGRPSDNATGLFRGNCKATSEHIANRVALLAGRFRNRVMIHTLGFANPEQDFSVLASMAQSARDAGATGDFVQPALSRAALGSAIAHTVSSLSTTRSRLTTIAAASGAPRMLRKVERESAYGGCSWSLAQNENQTVEDGDWLVHMDGVKRFGFCSSGLRSTKDPWQAKGFISGKATGIAIHRKAFGEGAERLVFKLQEYNGSTGQRLPLKLVAKESKHERRQDLKMAFHVCFARTQKTAKKMGERFNTEVKRRLSVIDPSNTQRSRVFEIHFLPCSVYTFIEDDVERSVLVEEYLPHAQYMKWNGNNGYVRGRDRASHWPSSAALGPATHTDMAWEGQMVGNNQMGAIPEEQEEKREEREMGEDKGYLGDECYDSDDSCTASVNDREAIDYGLQQAVLDSTSMFGNGDARKRNANAPPAFDPKAEDFLQAFSHFSYYSSARRMLVCDLQGVMSRNTTRGDVTVAGQFQLTDPVIHYRSTSGRKQVYGKTDLGKKGAHRFFSTHDCNDVCRLLGLPPSVSKRERAKRFLKRRRTGPRPTECPPIQWF